MKNLTKKVSLLLLTIASAALLCGCGGSTDTDGGESAPESQESQAENQTQEKGYVFSYQGVSISVDALAAPIVEQLGEPASYFEAASCAFEGLDKMYTYNSVEIDTYPAEDGDRISSILFKDDMVATPEGVGLFQTRADMIAAYGEDFTEENGLVVYEKDGMSLRFILENDEIVSIEYVSNVLN